MISTAFAKIFLAEDRFFLRTHAVNKYSTFKQETPKNLFVFDEIFIAPNQEYGYEFPYQETCLFIPVTGQLEISCNTYLKEIKVGEIAAIKANKQAILKNKYLDSVIHLLVICLKIDHILEDFPTWNFDTHKQQSKLLAIGKGLHIPIYLGTFKGREKAIYHLQNDDCQVFAFVLEGAFEMEDRLLQPKDALLLSKSKSIEMEALSQHAVILLLEI